MGYTTLWKGSSGDEVKKLQEKLTSMGYGSTVGAADGIFGAKTESAVRKYQQDNGLAVDGIAGKDTLGKLYTGQASAQETVQEVPGNTGYDPAKDSAYQTALEKLTQAEQNKPTYAGTFDQQIQEIYDKIMNREPFSYDLNADALWQQLSDQYVQAGRMAMQDTQGQAAALTGGYGNSYGQAAGQQVYNQYLQGLSERAPELYELALSRYQQEGSELENKLALTGQMAADEYGKHTDALNLWQQEIDRAQSEADTAYNRGYAAWADRQSMAQTGYDRLVQLITSTGYTPSQTELQAAGMSAGEAAAYGKYYTDSQVPVYSGSSGGGGTRTSGTDKAADDFQLGDSKAYSNIFKQAKSIFAKDPEAAVDYLETLTRADGEADRGGTVTMAEAANILLQLGYKEPVLENDNRFYGQISKDKTSSTGWNPVVMGR